jgi:hypothetical protein
MTTRTVLVAAALLVAGPLVAPSLYSRASSLTEPVLHGVWKITEIALEGQVSLVLEAARGDVKSSSWGRPVHIATLEGLDPPVLEGPDTQVSFRIVRDAGTFACEGTAGRGQGAGVFALALDPAFATALEQRGVGRPTKDQQIRLALADVGFPLLDALGTHGYPKPDVVWMVKLADHGANEKFVTKLAAQGYRLGTLERLVQARDRGVDPGFIKGLKKAGFGGLTYEQLLRARDRGVDDEYIAEMRELGAVDLGLEDYIRLRDQGVDPDYVHDMRGVGYRDASLDDLRQARNHGVTPEYVDALADAGFDGLSLRKVIRARDVGVSASFARQARADLGKDATIDDVIAWRNRGGR